MVCIKNRDTVILTGVLLITAFSLIFPASLVKAQTTLPPSSPQPQAAAPQTCSISSRLAPSDALDMNSVIINNTAKTIHVEKEIFQCRSPNQTTIIKDVSIYSEIIEKDISNRDAIMHPIMTIEAITCTKEMNTGNFLDCRSQPVGLVSCLNTSACIPTNVTFPIEMETVTSLKGGIVKTIESQKEVFACNEPFRTIKDVTVFTEIFEKIGSATAQPFKISMSITCLKDEASAKVTACQVTEPKQILP
jgi:hypothetical protein